MIKKQIARVLFGLILLNTVSTTALAKGFTDITEKTKNGTAILYLQEHGVINGYDDGTFRPTNNVNRAEFLKIIIEGSKIKLDVTEDVPFKDIQGSIWYTPYIKKAYAEGWINGYNDNTFKPDQTITKVEALKILGKARNWNLKKIDTGKLKSTYRDVETKAWYSPYLAYAINNKLLQEKGKIFSPTSATTRGNISEILYRTITNKTTVVSSDKSNDTENKTTSDPPSKTPNITTNKLPEIPVPPTVIIEEPKIVSSSSDEFALIAKDSFDNIELEEELPNTFYKNEVFVIKGKIINGTYDNAIVILDHDQEASKYFSGKTTNNSFAIPIYFKNSGDFSLGLIPGNSGSSKAYRIHVNSQLPSPSNEDTPPPPAPLAASEPLRNFQIKYAKDTTSISFDNTLSTLKTLTLNQNGAQITYLSRQNIDTINLVYKDFNNFSAGNVNYTMDLAKISSQLPLKITSTTTKSQTKTFTAVEHSYDEITATDVETTIPDKIDFPGSINLIGTAKTDLKIEALIIKPDGNVDHKDLNTSNPTETYFEQQLLKKNGNFTLTYTPATSGRYIVEVNNKNSEPSINHPVYVGDIYPLIPDYFDLNERKFFTGTFDLPTERAKLLNLINISRNKHGLQSITLDPELNTLAQNHTNDMQTNNYFSHYNLQNEAPEDRRLKLGITTPVGENLATDISVEFAHEGLMRSASHHENILTPEWARVGLGIALKDGQLTIVEEFSTNPITTSDLATFKSDLLSKINQLRVQKNIIELIELGNLTNAAKELTEKFKNSETVTNTSLSEALDNNNYSGAAQMIGRVSDTWSSIYDSLVNDDNNLQESKWQKIGIDIQTDKIGKIYTIVIVGSDN